MKKKKQQTINRRRNAPIQIPETATEHISLRVTPSMKEYFRNQSNLHDLSITKYIFNIFDSHFGYHISNEFVLDNSGYANADHCSKKSKSNGSYVQKVWNFIKSV